MSASKTTFAPLPARAIGDQRLTGSHYRVLAAICLHDRMSASRGKGQGCWAGNKTLAEECGCNYNNLSTAITDLGRWGYVERESHPLNKRLRVYRVNYNDADLALAKASNSSPIDEASPPLSDRTVRPETNEPASTVRPHFRESKEYQEDAEVNIFRETGNRLRRNVERDSAEAAPLGSGASSVKGELNIGAHLARFERAVKEGAIQDLGIFQQWHDWLEELHDSLDISDPNHGRAYRLLEEIDWPAEVYSQSTERSLAQIRGGHDEVPNLTAHANGNAQQAFEDGANGKAPASPATAVPDDESILAESFPKLYDAFAPCEAPWEPTPGDPEVLERLIEADRDQRAQAAVVLAKKGRDAAAAWVKAHLAAKSSTA